MTGDVRLRRHPTRHPAGAMVMALAVMASPAVAGFAEDWTGAATRCFEAVDEGRALATDGYSLVDGEAGGDWADRIWRKGGVAIVQRVLEAGGSVDPRVCDVRNIEYLSLGSIAAVTGAYADMLGRLTGDRGYVQRQFPPGYRKGNGMVSELRSSQPGPRGCRVAVSFVTAPADGLVIFSVSEIGRQPCGALPAEGSAG
ncbi:hypothetical protein [Chachezhania antarctica]|uniref:hypothetical protein n=1 Tax=Chachezhania antarctica TaxID=2340860 RepID=UPI000EB49982|nr:hypothetical protein [Chachezhania antarctica]|tara:strand:+ start:9886 stop:10482 length:597 start_codon:yes stop_codon:yes gene_type:complete